MEKTLRSNELLPEKRQFLRIKAQPLIDTISLIRPLREQQLSFAAVFG